jgi:predicted aspartyl protease
MENPYATFLNPPAPFVVVRIESPAGIEGSDSLLAQLDCGADRTVIPFEEIEKLSLSASGTAYVAGLGGEVEEARLYDVKLTITGFGPIAVEILANSGEQWVLLGRDVLNRYRVVLDGPNQRLEIA